MDFSMDFNVEECVLCYEPDPPKIKVIYNAKILDFEDGEYLVHFRGWNSSWDRWVTKEHFLKDNPKNCILQDSLAENMGKKDSLPRLRKKSPSRKRVLPIPSSVSNGVLTEAAPLAKPKKRLFHECNIKITGPCKTFLKVDMARVGKQKLIPIHPSTCPIAKVLENYVIFFAEKCVAMGEKTMGKQSLLPPGQREILVASELESIQTALNICKETMEGLRIILDQYCTQILLYEEESRQQIPSRSLREPSPKLPGSEPSRRPSTTDPSSSSGRSTPTNSMSSLPSSSSINKTFLFKCVADSLSEWKLLPDSFYEETPLLPCVAYGPIYILRLFIKLPDILKNMNLPPESLKAIQKQISSLMDYLGSHPEYFSENMYSAAPPRTSS
uniref:Male-specific lethal 3-like 1 n=1 Tax=Caligus clemensi TaxID=344056 RepID=C1C2C1_CALCM|nr:Male-specific lethal 3-like 1 [Caligus clemensi]